MMASAGYDAREAIVRAKEATLAQALDRRRKGAPQTPQQLGYVAELLYCQRFAAAAWYTLPRWLRRRINGGGHVDSRDYGVDAVTFDGDTLVLIQIKWYAPGAAIGVAADQKLAYLADQARKGLGLNYQPKTILAFRKGTRAPGKTSSGAGENERQELTEDDIGMPPELARIADPAGEPARGPDPDNAFKLPDLFGQLDLDAGAGADSKAPAFAELQAEICARARHLTRVAGNTVVRMRLPTGIGKSYIILDLAQDYRDVGPVAVIAPRVEIVRQLSELARGRGWARVLFVAEGAPWPAELAAGDLVISTGQSVRTLEARPARPAALFIDEAHSHEGHEAAAGLLLGGPVRYELSACLEGKPDIEVSHRDAVARGLICQAQFAFDVYPRQPSLDDIAAELAAHPEHGSVLACFQTCESARRFARACERAGAGPARTFVDDDSRQALEEFKTGAIRVLCVVGRVEMGINVHRCNTVLLAEPWASWKRTLQLIGRGARLHPTKSGFFTVLCPVGPEDVIERRVAALVETLHAECAAFDPQTFDEVADLVEVREAGRTLLDEPADEKHPGDFAGEARNDSIVSKFVAAVRREIYDAVGRRIEDPRYVARLRYERARELVAAADPPVLSYREYGAWRAGHSAAADLPVDPAAEFSELSSRTFSWDEFLGLPPLPADFAARLSAAADELAANGFDVGAAMAGEPAAPFYKCLRDTEAGRSLPEIPLRGDDTWRAAFAPLYT